MGDSGLHCIFPDDYIEPQRGDYEWSHNTDTHLSTEYVISFTYNLHEVPMTSSQVTDTLIE